MFRGRKLINNFIFSNNHQCNYTKTIGSLQVAIHVVQNRRAGEQKGQDKQRKLQFKIMYVFCLSCPSATFAHQHGGFVPREWLPAKSLLVASGDVNIGE